jgi:hypothetical protein
LYGRAKQQHKLQRTPGSSFHQSETPTTGVGVSVLVGRERFELSTN